MITRNQVAVYLANNITDNRHEATINAASWLVDGHLNQIDYLVQDVSAILESRGYLYARVTTSHKVSPDTLNYIEKYLKEKTGAKTVEFDLATDPSLLGGVRIDTPTAQIESSVKKSLAELVQRVGQYE